MARSLGGLTALLAAAVDHQPGRTRRCDQAIGGLPIGNSCRRRVFMEGGGPLSPVGLVERQEAVLRVDRELVGAAAATVQPQASR